MSCMAEWDNTDVLNLIELYEKHPVLWNMKHGGHSNKLLKQKAWEVIGDALGVHPAEAKRKMDSLLSSFRRERCRVKKQAEEGKDKGSRWYAYNSLLFLLDKYEDIDTLDEDSTVRYKPQKSSDDVTFIRLEAVHDPPTPEDTSPPPPKSPSPRKSKRSKSIKRQISQSEDDFKATDFNSQDILSQSTDVPPRTFHQPPQQQQTTNLVSTTPIFSTPILSASATLRDECTTYGEHVANKLRQYSKRTQAIVQYHINNVLFQADISGFEHSTELAIDSTSAVLLARSLATESPAEAEQ